jgi:diguanylate cyclase (GGDEF)-like protein
LPDPEATAQRYTDDQGAWELHRRMVVGLRRASLGTLFTSWVAFGAEVLLRLEDLSVDGLGASARRLSVAFAVALALYAYVSIRGVETRRPYLGCSVLFLVICTVDGLCATGSGGLQSPFAYGIVALLMAWPLIVPGGWRLAAPPLIGGLACYQFAFWFGSGEHPPQARVVVIALFQLAAVITAFAAAEMLQNAWLQIAAAASVDELTGLKSRRYFFERLEDLWRLRARRSTPLALAVLDVDHFKAINDQHGHAAGDEMLRLLSAAVGAVVRGSDFAGRLGGDEIVVALSDCDGAGALEVVERLRRRIAETPLLFRGATIRTTVSAGVAAVPATDRREAAAVLHDADLALYQSKAAGRDRATLAAPTGNGDGS